VKNRTCVVCVTEHSVSRQTLSLTVANIQDMCRSRVTSAVLARQQQQRVLSGSRLRPTWDATSSLCTVFALLLHDVFTLHRPKSLNCASFSVFAFSVWYQLSYRYTPLFSSHPTRPIVVMREWPNPVRPNNIKTTLRTRPSQPLTAQLLVIAKLLQNFSVPTNCSLLPQLQIAHQVKIPYFKMI